MLASLLPGLRQIRAPLAAGYLWLVALWLLFFSERDSRAESWGGWQALLDLREHVSVIGAGVAISFVAYLIGAISEPAASTAGKFAGYAIASALEWAWWRAAPSPQASPWMGPRERYPAAHFRGVSVSSDGHETLRRLVQDRISAARGAPIDGFHFDPSDMLAELPLVERRLAAANFELYTEIDRQRAEAEFRLSIWLPLLATAFAFGWRSGWHLLEIAGILALGSALASVLVVQGYLRNRRVNDTLVGIVRAGMVDFPLLEREFPVPAQNAVRTPTAPAPAASAARLERGQNTPVGMARTPRDREGPVDGA